MPRPHMRPAGEPADTLSRISEGSNEAGSVTSSYFSAASGCASSALGRLGKPVDAEFLARAGSLRLPAKATVRQSGMREPSSSPGTPQSNTSGNAAALLQDPAALREIVKAFVEAGVRGRRAEALRSDGRPQQVVFRLSRQVDSFEIGPEGARGHSVSLTEVSAVYTGDHPKAQKELAQTMPGLDATCAVVDLRDGRCLTLRFPVDGEAKGHAAEAQVFAHCMQIFVNEVRRETGSGGYA
eukprot:gb/GFBE01079514.1/.p1 GENE.gb/GFBE01079514.1/~~gb/GFBE01079514.1/.p1  ORF type:complete len:240 (+),score=32.27 gb/GFBE01079514.1/:1-720(+)